MREAERSLRQAYWQYRNSAREHEVAARLDAAWACLEAAHILGQRNTVLHVKVHITMLEFAWRQRRAKEIVGQLVRIVAAAAMTCVWMPAGNIGRADVSAFRPMPIPNDLAALLHHRETATANRAATATAKRNRDTR